MYQGFIGQFVHSLALDRLEIVSCGICVINDAGRIVRFDQVVDEEGLDEIKSHIADLLQKEIVWKRLQPSQFIIPGFVDAHTHAPQYDNLGLGLDLTLLEWLEKVTIPREAWFEYGKKSELKAEHRLRVGDHFRQMVRHYLRHGSTTVCYFGTIYLEANQCLADVIRDVGQRALVGKVCMDCNAPDYYVESASDSLHHTIDFVQYVKSLECERVLPIVTPRFAITCSGQLLESLGQLATEQNLHIQSHLSESLDEIAFVKELFPESTNYAEVYDKAGLLNDRTIMAHCVHLEEDERALLKQRDTAVAHCPNSNFSLTSGILNVRQLLQDGIKVGLGSDVAGGYSISMLDALRQAIIASKAVHFSNKQFKPLDVAESFYLATLGGAAALRLGKVVGNFEVDKQFDALLIGIESTGSNIVRRQDESLKSLFERFIFCGDDRNISRVYVSGAEVHSHESK